MPKSVFAAALIAALAAGPGYAADGSRTAWVENLSKSTLCPVVDNVTLTLTGPKVRTFEIEASAPVYAPDLKTVGDPPDVSNCAPQPAPPPPPKPVTIFEDADTRVTGFEAAFAQGPEVIVGEARSSRLALITLARKVDGAFREMLTLNPVTGFWLARPAEPEGSPTAAYGSGFFVGPIEDAKAPVVAITRIKIDPQAAAFRMTFEKGGVGEVKVLSLDAGRIVLKATLDGLSVSDPPKPFAAFRSMFVSPTNANVGRVNWRTEKGLYNEPVMTFKGADASEVRFDRIEVSKTKSGAPDVTFRAFRGVEPPAQ